MASAARAEIGHNNPPALTPYEAIKAHIDDLMETAQGFLDGDAVETQEIADEIGKLLDEARKAEKAAEDQRKIEARPFDDGKAAVQALWTPLKGKCGLVASTAKQALAPFLAAKQARIDAEAAEARKSADEATRKAQEALRAAAPTDLVAREQAEAMLTVANKAGKAADRAEKGKAMVAGGSKAISLRTSYRAEVTDYAELARWAWLNRRSDYEAFLDELAGREARRGPVSIPGLTVHTERNAA